MKTLDSQFPDNCRKWFSYALIGAVLIGLYFTSLYNYLLFHCLAEIFSIVVACSLFMIAWNSRQYIKNPYLLFIGIAYLFIGILDLFHTLAYKGMPIFTDYDYYANQLWIAARYMESISLLLAFIFLRKNRPLRPYLLLVVYGMVSAVLIASIFWWKIFPVCFVAGVGLTPFKKISEYIICAILGGCIFLLNKNRARFEGTVYRLLLWSMICTIISELAFTFYISNYGFSNMVGHYFKIFSFALVYEAIIKTGIETPYSLIFRELNRTNRQMTKEIKIRMQTEKELKKAISEVKTLSGMLPICASCKKIRDDQGYWRQIESYIKQHSEADFSHSICPDCMKELYPDIYERIIEKG